MLLFTPYFKHYSVSFATNQIFHFLIKIQKKKSRKIIKSIIHKRNHVSEMIPKQSIKKIECSIPPLISKYDVLLFPRLSIMSIASLGTLFDSRKK